MEVIQRVVRATARSASGVPMLLKAWSPSGHTSRSARLPASCQADHGHLAGPGHLVVEGVVVFGRASRPGSGRCDRSSRAAKTGSTEMSDKLNQKLQNRITF